MNRTERDKSKLRDFIRDIQISSALALNEARAENIELKAQVALLRREKLWAGSMIDASDEQLDRLLADVTGRVATVKPPKPGITRFHIGGVTEIADMRIKG